MSTNPSVASPAAFPLPALPRAGASSDALSPNQRRAMVAAIVAAHAAGVYGLMQLGAVREAVREAAPMFVDLIAPPAPAPVPPVPLPPPPVPVPVPKKAPPPAPVIAAAPSPAPAAFVVAAPPPEPPVEAVPAPAVAVAAVPAPPASPPPAKIIPASAVEYLEPPALVYPRLSLRQRESGRVVVRVYIDAAGLPRSVQIATSSGFARLDDAAVAAVQKARFKPYTENGQPTAGWAAIPLDFDLEK